MGKRDKRKYSYILTLAASSIVVVLAFALGIVKRSEHGIMLSMLSPVNEVQSEVAAAEKEAEEIKMMVKAADTETAEEIEKAEAEEETGEAKDEGTDEAEKADEADDVEEKETEETGEAEEDETDETEEIDEMPDMYEADVSYFDDALFIGDSRTVGLAEYGDLGEAEVVADSGMSVYKIFNKKFRTSTGEKKLLETVLSEKKYGKIYLMLGINELGYDYNVTVAKYERLIGRIRELQPDALIFLEGNLHITAEKSGSSPDVTNENIDRFNEAVSAMADDRTMFYLDVNEIFDDGNGNLEKKYTTDHVHILAKYYTQWAEWILKHAR